MDYLQKFLEELDAELIKNETPNREEILAQYSLRFNKLIKRGYKGLNIYFSLTTERQINAIEGLTQKERRKRLSQAGHTLETPAEQTLRGFYRWPLTCLYGIGVGLAYVGYALLIVFLWVALVACAVACVALTGASAFLFGAVTVKLAGIAIGLGFIPLSYLCFYAAMRTTFNIYGFYGDLKQTTKFTIKRLRRL